MDFCNICDNMLYIKYDNENIKRLVVFANDSKYANEKLYQHYNQNTNGKNQLKNIGGES